MEAQLTSVTDHACQESNHSRAASFFTLPRHLLGRLYLLSALLILDCLVRSSLPHAESFLAPVASFGIIAFAVFLGLGYPQLKQQREPLPFNFGLFVGHLACLSVLCLESMAAVQVAAVFAPAPLLALRLVLILLAAALLALACIPLRTWIETLRSTGWLWLYAAGAGALACALRSPLQSIWSGAASTPGRWLQQATFSAVAVLLRPILPGFEVDAPAFVMGTPSFSIFVAQACSGLEGLGLVLVFTVAWLLYFRKESRFPHALLLVPCALACVWLLNVVRIAALVMIGNAGSPDVAMLGFHSQAGWIAFTGVALGFSIATRKLAWVRSVSSPGAPAPVSELVSEAISEEVGESPATPAYLLPFLAILAAGFIAKAASGSFEWLYPLRFVAAAAVLWRLRGWYRGLSLQFDWRAPAAGLAVFLLWIAPELWTASPSASPIGDALAALSPLARFSWIAVRVASACITVPIAEELAFRGYLARRIVARDFERVPYAGLTLIPVLISSIAFGLMHGRNWIAGILAGLAFAGLLRSKHAKSGLGAAIAAHATANLLLALWVLSRHDWSQW